MSALTKFFYLIAICTTRCSCYRENEAEQIAIGELEEAYGLIELKSWIRDSINIFWIDTGHYDCDSFSRYPEAVLVVEKMLKARYEATTGERIAQLVFGREDVQKAVVSFN